MKPKISCPKCNTELAFNQSSCPSCGTTLDWPGGGSRKQAKTQTSGGGSAFPIRNVILLVAVIAGGVWLLETLTAPKVTPPPAGGMAAQQAPVMQGTPTGPDMSQMPHIQELEAQVKADPTNLQLRRDLGNHLMDARFYDRAIAVYKEYLTRDPKNPDVRVDMGICYKEAGDLAAAAKEMKTALQYAPKHLYAHFNIGIVALAGGDVVEANEWFKKTIALDPKSDVGMKAQQLLQQHAAVPKP